jgi:cytosine/adenosine deaminase-related metal-dependent hydrolase
LLGKIENNYKRYGVKNLAAFASGVARYLQQHSTHRTGLIHCTHKTDEEKRVKRNAKARATRAAKKAPP